MARLPAELPAGPVTLCRGGAADTRDALAAMRDSIDDLRLWMDWAADGVPTEAAQREAFRRAETAFEDGTEFGYTMRELATGEVVGGCGLMPRIGPGAIEIGYWVRSDRHRRGYAVSAAGALTTAAFEWLPEVERVELHIDAANKASAGVAEKLGYEAIRREERERVTPGQSGSCVIWAMNRVRWDQPGGDSTRTQRMSG